MTNLNVYLNNLKADKKSINTINAYERDIQSMLNFINKEEQDITYMDMLTWKGEIAALSSSTICRKISAVKGYFQFLVSIGIMESNPCDNITRVKINNKQKKPLTSAQVRAMIDNAKNIRDKAIISLLFSSCMRVSEVINLRLDQWSADIEYAYIVGKGDKTRTIYFNEESKQYINEYLTVRKNGCSNLFVSNQGTPMCEIGISKMLKTTAKRTNIIDDISSVAPHLCRATGATLQAQAGVPIQVIQEVLGHSSLETTRIYVKNNTQQIKEAMTAKIF